MRNYFDGWHRCFSFGGKSTRAEFWTFHIVNLLLVIVLRYVDIDIFTGEHPLIEFWGGIVSLLWSLLVLTYFIASWSIAVRRLRDTGNSGFFILLCLVPLIGWFILFIYFLLPSED